MSGTRLAGKTALVTGGASGLGFAMARRFLSEGAAVIVSDIDPEGEARITDLGARFELQDVTDEAAWESLFGSLVSDGLTVDVLVNNAGFADGGLGELLEDVALADVQRIFRVNVEGTFLGCKHAIRHMKNRGGSIINMSSIGGLVPVPFIAAYGASKAAVRHLTQSVGLYCAQQGYRIRCNSIHPGQIQTPMHDRLVDATARQQGVPREAAEAGFRSLIPAGEFGQPEDVAEAALYLASDASRHVTGDRMLVDGGMMLTS